MYFAQSSGGIGSLFTSLGLNLQAFILYVLAFMVMVAILGKYVYPYLIKALDAKQQELEAAAKHERAAREGLEKAEANAVKIISKARDSADEIIAAAHKSAAEQLEQARKNAALQTERIVTEAREQLEHDVAIARRELKAETGRLVAVATEALLREKLTDERDRALIGRALGGE